MQDLQIEYISIAEVNPYSGNAKEHPKKQVQQIAESIKEFGFSDPVAVWGADNTIIEGHGRVLAAQMLGMYKIPIIRLDALTDEQRRAYTLVHNQLTMNTGFDIEQLQIELDGITGIEMEPFDFSISDIEIQIDEMQEKYQQSKERTRWSVLNIANLERGQFAGAGEYDIPILEPVTELPPIKEWIGFNYVLSDDNPEGKAVHFFIDDYQFERVWNTPRKIP